MFKFWIGVRFGGADVSCFERRRDVGWSFEDSS